MKSLRIMSCLFLIPMLARVSLAAEPPSPQPSPVPPIREIGDGIFQIGDVTFDKNAKTATFPASVNMSAGLIEYLLVGTNGKTHESLFVTKVEPYHLHLAMLLIGATGTPPDGAKAIPPTAIDAGYLKNAPTIKGDAVTISVRWKIGDKEVTMPAEDFVTNEARKKPMTRGPWTYNGSQVIDGKFLAQEELSFIALVTDPAALLNNPRPGSDNDENWLINMKKAPPEKTSVEITIKLEPPSKPNN